MTMASTDAMDQLAEQLKRFHISARINILAENEHTNQCEDENRTENNDGGEAASKQSNTSSALDDPPSPSGLPTPRPGCRPVWEPPVLDYSDFEKLLEAQKKFAAREGNKDVAFRTEVMDMVVERKLSFMYGDWIRGQVQALGLDASEQMFWYDLDAAVWEDIGGVGVSSVAHQHGRRRKDVRDTVDPIFVIMDEDDPDQNSNDESYYRVTSMLSRIR